MHIDAQQSTLMHTATQVARGLPPPFFMTFSDRDHSQVYCDLEWIDPELAQKYLQSNNCNRAIRPTSVEQYVSEMSQNDWHLGCDAIGFDLHGTLINGQHRLYAVAGSGKTIPFLVARGLPPESKNSLDIGKKRLLHERITIAGYSMLRKEASICNQLMTPWSANVRVNVKTTQERNQLIEIHKLLKDPINEVMEQCKKGIYITELTAAVFVAEHARRFPSISKKHLDSNFPDQGTMLEDFISLCKNGHRANGKLLPIDIGLKSYREEKLNAVAKSRRVTNMEYYRKVVSTAYKYVEGIPAKQATSFKNSNPFLDIANEVQDICTTSSIS